MEKISKLENLVDGRKRINFEELPDLGYLKENGYNFIDEKAYLIEKAAYLSGINNIDFMLAINYIPRRNFIEEYDHLTKINEAIPKNSVKPLVLVYDNSIKKDYIRGYITKTSSETTNLKKYLQEGLHGKIHLDIEMIMSLERQLEHVSNKLKKEDIYNSMPNTAFDIENIDVDKNNCIVLMNMNHYLSFNKGNGKTNDKELKKTINYLNKIKNRNWDYLHESRRSNPLHY